MVRAVERDRSLVRVAARVWRMEMGARNQTGGDRRGRRMGPARPYDLRGDVGARRGRAGADGTAENLDPPETGRHHHVEPAFHEEPRHRTAGREGRPTASSPQIVENPWIAGPQAGRPLRQPEAEVEQERLAIRGPGSREVGPERRDHLRPGDQSRPHGQAQGDRMAPAATEPGFVGHRHEVVGGREHQGAAARQPAETPHGRDGLAGRTTELGPGTESAETPPGGRIVEECGEPVPDPRGFIGTGRRGATRSIPPGLGYKWNVPHPLPGTPTMTTAPASSPPGWAARPTLWARWPTRTRMIVLVIAIDLLAALLSCGVIVLNARSAVEVEMKAALSNVELLVSDTIDLAQAASPDTLLQTLRLRVQGLRHVRVTVLDAAGAVVPAPSHRQRRDAYDAPHWFVALIAPEPRQHELPIVVQGKRLGTARITTQPRDEIDEVWGYAVSLSLASLIVSLGLLAALYVAFGRVLAPLTQVADGLTQLERQDYTARLAPPASRELAVIAARFNSVAQALSETRAANGRLNRQLLSAQDDERRATALELHDEFGPCLFALEANAASVIRMAAAEAAPDRGKLTQRAEEISAIVGQVQTLNRDLLNRLRPHALGQVPLPDCLVLLLRDFTRRHSGTAFTGTFDRLGAGYGDVTDLTVFRCIQESMTNAVRHGGAARVTVEAGEVQDGSGSHLAIEVHDDGRGITPDHRVGLGLSGMRERVEALGGTLALDNGRPGTVVRIMIPFESERSEDSSAIPAA